MTLDIFNTVLAIASFVLSVAVSYGQLKILTARAAMSGVESLNVWLRKREKESEFLAYNPSAFVAFCVKRLVLAAGLFFVTPYFLHLSAANPLELPGWLALGLAQVIPILCGVVLGLLTVRADEVIDILRKQPPKA